MKPTRHLYEYEILLFDTNSWIDVNSILLNMLGMTPPVDVFYSPIFMHEAHT